MAELPIDLEDDLSQRLCRFLDVEGKIPRAFEALGPIAGRDVLLLDGTDGIRALQLRDLGARVAFAGAAGADGSVGFGAPDASADIVISLWSPFRGAAPDELAEAQRVLRPGGRLLVVHDYGRDDVAHLRGERPEYGHWSRPRGPFLSNGFKVRVVHCFWTFESIEEGAEFLVAAFADAGRAVATALKRPRLSYNVAIYHRTFGEVSPSEPSGMSG
jgi:SAM-dependent methyltransferase